MCQETGTGILGSDHSGSENYLRFLVEILPYFTCQVEFSPTLSKLASIVNNTAKELTTCLSVFPRLPDQLTPVRSDKEVCISGVFTTSDT